MTRRVFGEPCTRTGERIAPRYGVVVRHSEVPPASGMATSPAMPLRLLCASARC